MTMAVPSHAFDRSRIAASLHLSPAGEAGIKRDFEQFIVHDKSVVDFLMEGALGGLWFWDLESDCGWMSPRFWELLGVPELADGPGSGRWGRFLHPETAPAVMSRFRAYCAQPDQPYDEILHYRHIDGSSVWVRSRGMAVRNASGKAIRLIGAHSDITALKRTEAELTQSLAKVSEANAWLQMAEQIGRIGHWRLSLTDQTLVWSDEIYRIFGVTPETYRPTLQSAMSFFHPEDRPKVESMVAAAMRDGRTFDYALRLVPRDAEIRYVSCRGVARRDAAGAVSMLVGVFADISEQREMEEALRQANARLEGLANVDSLTGLANRRRFDDVLGQEWRRAARERSALSLVMVDIDRFKGFNDRYGHLAGDECLRRVAGVLARHGRRPSDLAARYGGEEMALLLPATSVAGAEIVARECRSAIAALNIWHEGNESCGGVVTASFGVATAQPPEDSEIPDCAELLAEADRLLYEAKRTGRNKVVTLEGSASAIAPLPADEEARLLDLARYDAAGATRRSHEMDGIARLAATLTGTPVGLVTLVERDTQRFAGNFGLPGVEGSKRDDSFCAHTILGDETMVVPDALRDPRFKDNQPFVGNGGVRYYAGAPIVSPSTGHKLGALCVVDTQARGETSSAQRAILTDLAGMVAALLEDRVKQSEEQRK